jgi:hypothetical protein
MATHIMNVFNNNHSPNCAVPAIYVRMVEGMIGTKNSSRGDSDVLNSVDRSLTSHSLRYAKQLEKSVMARNFILEYERRG